MHTYKWSCLIVKPLVHWSQCVVYEWQLLLGGLKFPLHLQSPESLYLKVSQIEYGAFLLQEKHMLCHNLWYLHIHKRVRAGYKSVQNLVLPLKQFCTAKRFVQWSISDLSWKHHSLKGLLHLFMHENMYHRKIVLHLFMFFHHEGMHRHSYSLSEKKHFLFPPSQQKGFSSSDSSPAHWMGCAWLETAIGLGRVHCLLLSILSMKIGLL